MNTKNKPQKQGSNAALSKGGETYLFWPYNERWPGMVKVTFVVGGTDNRPHRCMGDVEAHRQFKALVKQGFTRNPEIERFYADLKP